MLPNEISISFYMRFLGTARQTGVCSLCFWLNANDKRSNTTISTATATVIIIITTIILDRYETCHNNQEATLLLSIQKKFGRFYRSAYKLFEIP